MLPILESTVQFIEYCGRTVVVAWCCCPDPGSWRRAVMISGVAGVARRMWCRCPDLWLWLECGDYRVSSLCFSLGSASISFSLVVNGVLGLSMALPASFVRFSGYYVRSRRSRGLVSKSMTAGNSVVD